MQMLSCHVLNLGIFLSYLRLCYSFGSWMQVTCCAFLQISPELCNWTRQLLNAFCCSLSKPCMLYNSTLLTLLCLNGEDTTKGNVTIPLMNKASFYENVYTETFQAKLQISRIFPSASCFYLNLFLWEYAL